MKSSNYLSKVSSTLFNLQNEKELETYIFTRCVIRLFHESKEEGIKSSIPTKVHFIGWNQRKGLRIVKGNKENEKKGSFLFA